MINDRRDEKGKAETIGFVVATDRQMSGWGQAPGRSIFAVPIRNDEELDNAMRKMEARSDMLRVRFCLPTYRPRLFDGDHLSIAECGCPWVRP